MRAVGGDEMQQDASAWLGEPFPYHLGVVIGGVVEKDVDQPHRRVHRLDAGQQGDGADDIDGQHVDHAGLAGLKIDGAVDVETVTAAGLLHGEFDFLRSPAADRADPMGRMHRVGEEAPPRQPPGHSAAPHRRR